LAVAGRRCLDAGASTGGFTDVLLRAGAEHVVAVDVGYGQLAWPLRSDPRVTVLDRVNVRQLTAAQVAPAPSLVTADLSFISLTLVLPALVACAAPGADLVLMVKPQFEVGKGKVGAGGVVRDPALREAAVTAVAAAAALPGLGAAGGEMVMVIGGDGTLLRAAELARGAGVPLLGVNLGHVGFLAETEPGDLSDAVDQVVAGEYLVEERMTVDVAVRVSGTVITRTWALNEATVEKAARERMIDVVAEVDGRPLARFGCG